MAGGVAVFSLVATALALFANRALALLLVRYWPCYGYLFEQERCVEYMRHDLADKEEIANKRLAAQASCLPLIGLFMSRERYRTFGMARGARRDHRYRRRHRAPQRQKEASLNR
jgi:hypothetical protein